jgi:hypothetical protein
MSVKQNRRGTSEGLAPTETLYFGNTGFYSDLFAAKTPQSTSR